jgi:hypothetical protein
MKPGDLVELNDWDPTSEDCQIRYGVIMSPLGGAQLVLVGNEPLLYRNEELALVE